MRRLPASSPLPSVSRLPDASAVAHAPPRNYVLAALAVVLVAALGAPLLGHLDLANIAMLFPLAVLFSAIRLGRGPAVLAALLSVLLFDVFFVPPRFTLGVNDLQYLLTFVVLLVVALITAELAARLRHERDVAEARGRQNEALYAIARDLSAALTVEQIAEVATRYARDLLGAPARLWAADDEARLQPAEAVPTAVATAFAEGRTVLGENAARCVPLPGPMRVRGVLELAPDQLAAEPSDALLSALASLLGIALERIHFVSVAQRSGIEIESERLRNALLSALSHDLRTPLTAIAGLADTVVLTPPALSPEQAEMVGAIRVEALRTGALVHNLLDMARFEAGGVRLRREWQPLEEIVGAALQSVSSLLGGHRLDLDLPADLPMVEVDAVLMERALGNLVENAAKYTPAGSTIAISARVAGEFMELSVCDDGPGLPEGPAEDLFARFVRGRAASGVSGTGLGLAIVDAVARAHGGRLCAANRAPSGACFTLQLPLGTPPAIEEPVA
mgnify:CR=1 FL=1